MSAFLKNFHLERNAAAILVTAVVYDYLLVLSREIDYVWNRPWSWISTLFVSVRYLGLFWVLIYGYLNCGLFASSVTVGTVIGLILAWIFELFNTASNLVMVLRVYAMWNRSRMILRVLLFICVPEVLISLVFTGIYNSSHPYFSVSILKTSDSSLCRFSYTTPSPHWLYMIPHLALGTLLVVLAVAQTLKQSFDMYRVTKRWQPNQYMKILVREGITYFIVRLLFNIINMTSTARSFNKTIFVLRTLVCIPLFSVLPRFIVGMREMYQLDLDRRWQGIDSAFGVLSKTIHTENVTLSAIALTEVISAPEQTTDGDVDYPWESQLEVVRDR